VQHVSHINDGAPLIASMDGTSVLSQVHDLHHHQMLQHGHDTRVTHSSSASSRRGRVHVHHSNGDTSVHDNDHGATIGSGIDGDDDYTTNDIIVVPVPIARARRGHSTYSEDTDIDTATNHQHNHIDTTIPTRGDHVHGEASSHVPLPPPILVSTPIPFHASGSSPAWYQDQHNHQYVLHLPDWLAQYLIMGVFVIISLFAFVTYKMFQVTLLRPSIGSILFVCSN
jgi:hypothetical protein